MTDSEEIFRNLSVSPIINEWGVGRRCYDMGAEPRGKRGGPVGVPNTPTQLGESEGFGEKNRWYIQPRSSYLRKWCVKIKLFFGGGAVLDPCHRRKRDMGLPSVGQFRNNNPPATCNQDRVIFEVTGKNEVVFWGTEWDFKPCRHKRAFWNFWSLQKVGNKVERKSSPSN